MQGRGWLTYCGQKAKTSVKRLNSERGSRSHLSQSHHISRHRRLQPRGTDAFSFPVDRAPELVNLTVCRPRLDSAISARRGRTTVPRTNLEELGNLTATTTNRAKRGALAGTGSRRGRVVLTVTSPARGVRTAAGRVRKGAQINPTSESPR